MPPLSARNLKPLQHDFTHSSSLAQYMEVGRFHMTRKEKKHGVPLFLSFSPTFQKERKDQSPKVKPINKDERNVNIQVLHLGIDFPDLLIYFQKQSLLLLGVARHFHQMYM